MLRVSHGKQESSVQSTLHSGANCYTALTISRGGVKAKGGCGRLQFLVSLFQILEYFTTALRVAKSFLEKKKRKESNAPLPNKGSSYFLGPAANLVVEVDADEDKEEATAEEDGSSQGGRATLDQRHCSHNKLYAEITSFCK